MRKSGVVVVVVLVFDCCLDLSFLFLYCFYRRLIFCFYPKNFLDFWWFYLSVAFLTFLAFIDDIWYFAYTCVCLRFSYVNRRGGGVVYSGNSFLSVSMLFLLVREESVLWLPW